MISFRSSMLFRVWSAGNGAKLAVWLAACALAGALAEPERGSTPRPRWGRAPRLSDHSHQHLGWVGPHVCRTRNSTFCCPGWTSKPNSMLCVVPLCRPSCGPPGSCVRPNVCRCGSGVEAPSCGASYSYPPPAPGGCLHICMNGGSCKNATCVCAPGWEGKYCTEPICREPCLHGGRCVAPDRCVCFQGLSGTRCEIDRRTGPCYAGRHNALCVGALEGVVCTRQLCCATVGKAWGHPCKACADLDCPVGHLRNLATKECQDIDECEAIPGLCAGGRCVNSQGSFRCECPRGQRRHELSNNCEDVDECLQPDICPNGKCVNTEGDYYCLCNPHFIPSPDKKFCIDGRVSECYAYLGETGECADKLSVSLSHRDCCCGFNMGRAWGPLCAPCPPRGATEWSHLCGGVIPPGWKRNDTGLGPGDDGYESGTGDDGRDVDVPSNHAKVNECMLRPGICGLGTCVDKDVGYSCSCDDGAEETVQDGSPTCLDVDECALQYCRGGVCVNKPGSFECRCPPGFHPVENGQRCSDTNECELTGGSMCTNGECTNIDGGFECTCNPGYESSPSGQACRDVDECRANPRVCRRGRCRNLPGGYECLCEPGYNFTLGYCADMDECADPANCQGGRCVNSEGSFQCVCSAGYRAAGDRRACLDVDECAELRVCRNAHCRNTPGSFRCACLPGFTLASDGRSCADDVQDLCYERSATGTCEVPGALPITRSQCCCSASRGIDLAWGMNCKECPKPGTEEYETLCPDGPSKDNNGADINECTLIPNVCPHGTCENLEPGYKCVCDPGYHADDDGICRDIDECDMHQSYCSGGQCRNSPGSFTCTCPSGTRLDERARACRDVDECGERAVFRSAERRGDVPPVDVPIESANPCDNGRCINTFGSYECECEHGFVLDSTAQHCIDNRRGSCWRRVVDGACEGAAPRALLQQECCCSAGLAWGSPCQACDPAACPCPKGLAKLDGATCRDIDECELDLGLCIGGRCVNTDGSYRCECPDHMTLDPAGNQCVDTRHEQCYAEYSGGRCAGALRVDVLRAVCCCSALGKAWGDARCEPCPKRGTDAFRNLCVSSFGGPSGGPWERPGPGGYGPDGTYIPGGYGPDGSYGPGGVYTNQSDVWNQVHPGGNWDEFGNDTDTGSGLIPGSLEVNECAAFPGLCGHGRCTDAPGSFHCECFPGYEQDLNNHTCVDVDECEIVADVCGAGECRNTPGAFTCTCRPGHRADPVSKQCVDIDECAESSLCPGGRCVNTVGSFRCECGAGLQLTPDGLGCRDVDECGLTSGICSNGACENLMGTYQCVCDDGYAQTTVKSHCEDIDECAEDAARCQHECVNTPGSYYCQCREGWHLRADGRSCRDVDECSDSPRVCGGGACRNTPGSYACECGDGLTTVTVPAPTCADIDECADIRDLCGAGQCHNTIGSFVCRCDDGYSVKPQQGAACTDDDECELGSCDCHAAADCTNVPGSFQCRCRDGWRGDGFECEDIDECATNNGGCHPRAACTNTDGSFVCLCDTGYKGDGYSCVDIDECSNDPSLCENGRCSNTPGGYECDCDVGFTRATDSRSCLDMDECATFDNVCVFGRCVNTYGMFKCLCNKGYQSDSVDDFMPGFNCTDIDECKSPQSCQYGACINTQGGYECRCPAHYDLVSEGTACFDSRRSRCYSRVTLRSGDAGEFCRDSDQLSDDASLAACCCSVGAAWGNYCDLCPEPGSEAYRQLCPGGTGYQPVLEPPSYVVTLADIDECAAHPALCAHGTCTNTFGSFVCTCAPGWRLAPGERACQDVDECAEPRCAGAGVCRNLPGGYVCLCAEGYQAMPDGKECVDVRQRQCYLEYSAEDGQCSGASGVPQTKYLCCCSVGQAWGAPCEPCPPRGSAEHVALCGERPGEYINPVTNDSRPIDECSLMPQLCRPGACRDTPQGFSCGCDHGYEHDTTSHICRDIDECAGVPAPCRGGLALCVNLPGTYECRCPAGYRLTPSLDECEDVDECSDTELCEHGECRNTIGSYRCECAGGYALRGGACVDIDECARPHPLCHNGTCHNTPGAYACHCDKGFKAAPNNDCVDINECREGGMVCRNGRCRNTLGSFRCECARGYVLTSDARHCRDVDECTELSLPCGPAGVAACTNTNGGFECACAPGYRLSGKRCVDRDECREIPNACRGGQCRNFDGGFVCDCPADWRFDEAGAACVDERRELCYDEWDAGRCHRPRPLRLTQAQCCCSEGAAWGRYCGRCPARDSPEFLEVCPGGMGRPNLTQDLDECAVRPDVCAGGRCVNTDGSFRCECGAGYELDADGRSCRDADECARAPRLCGNGTCGNTPGGYTCECSAGFTQGPQQTCVDIDECAEGRAGCSFRCHNTLGSFRCVCPFGYALADDGRHCRDVDECRAAPPPCRSACENTVGSYVCRCAEGYRRTSAPHDSDEACEDIDECEADPSLCGAGVCINSEGGYACDCDEGYRPSADQRACVDHRVGQCHRTLVAGRCAPDARRGGALPEPVLKAHCCCSLGVAWGAACELCPAPGSDEARALCDPANLPDVLVDSGVITGGEEPGSHLTTGGHGTHGGIGGGLTGGGLTHGGGGLTHGGGGLTHGGGGLTHGGGGLVTDGGNTFLDIDECAAMPDLCTPGRCINTIGSFRCVCPLGYKASGGVCQDVDECLAKPCQHICKNTEGSYECLCRSGYEVDEDGADCRDVDECSRGTHTCQQACRNTDGSYECACDEGYERRGDACSDINECEDPLACPGGRCVNLLGSFRCVCPRGLRPAPGGCAPRHDCGERCAGACRDYAGGYQCDCPQDFIRTGSGCVPRDPCADAPCGAAPCFPLGAAHRCGCPVGYSWQPAAAVCLQLEGGCAGAACLFGCARGSCGCPAGYTLVGAGHCLSALDAPLAGDIGDAPVFPLQEEHRAGGDDLISTEGCFSCKVNGRHRRAPEQGVIFANGTTILRRRRRRERRRRSLLEPHVDMVVVRATPQQTRSRAALVRLVPAAGGARAHYRIAYGDKRRDFALSDRDGTWALRLKRKLKPDAELTRQLEIEARFVPVPGKRDRRRRRANLDVPAPLKLYISVRIAPPKR